LSVEEWVFAWDEGGEEDVFDEGDEVDNPNTFSDMSIIS